MAKWVCEIDDADRIPEFVARAWTTALSGRPGPVIVALPENMLRAAVTQPACGPITLAEPALSHAQKAQLQACLQVSKRPVVLYGGSGWTIAAARQLERFACPITFRLWRLLGSMTFVTITTHVLSAMPGLACLAISKPCCVRLT